MKLTANKQLAKWIDAFVKREGIAEEACLRLVSPIEYPGQSSFDSLKDLDEDKEKYRVIAVTYPYEYYAPQLLISTPMLQEQMRFHKPKSDEEVIEMLKDMIAI